MCYKRTIPAFLLFASVLSGCQTQLVNTEPQSGYVSIQSKVLSHLPSTARVVISFIDDKGVVKQDELDGIRSFPYYYRLPEFSERLPSSVEVNISIGSGESVLSGEGVVSTGANVNIQLQALTGKDLANTYWQAVDISGRGLPPTVKTTLAFNNKGKLSGHAGCNHYRTAYSSNANFIEIEKTELTHQICSSPIMYHENRYLHFLRDAEYYSIDKEGNLSIYVSEREKPLKFSAATYQEVEVTMRAF